MEGFVTVKLLGSLSSAPGGKKVNELKLKAPSRLSVIFKELSDDHRLDIRRDSVLVLVNGVEANVLDDLETVVHANDQIVFIPMFHGGAS